MAFLYSMLFCKGDVLYLLNFLARYTHSKKTSYFMTIPKYKVAF